jgi:FtsZ-binding cell division protein ZapB
MTGGAGSFTLIKSAGDIVYTSSGTSLTTEMTSKANTANPTFTGLLKCASLTGSAASFTSITNTGNSVLGSSSSNKVTIPGTLTFNELTGNTGSFSYLVSTGDVRSSDGNFINVNASNLVQCNKFVMTNVEHRNKQLVLLDSDEVDDMTATQFMGLGANPSSFDQGWLYTPPSMRLQVPTNCIFKFWVGSQLVYQISNTGGANISDQRCKTDIADITGALQKICQLRGCSFTMQGSTKRQIGFIAQEVREVVPEVVDIGYDRGMDFHLLQYDRLTSLLCEGIKELKKENDELKNKNDELKKDLKNLSTIVLELKSEVDELKRDVAVLSQGP